MNENLKGALYIAIGACSYGVLATFVKVANNEGIGTGGLAFAQYFFGAVVLTVLSYFFSRKSEKSLDTSNGKNSELKLILFGTFLGFTSSLYYLSIQYVPVSVGIILLMQTIWMGVVVEWVINRSIPDALKIVGSFVVLVGTFLAVDAVDNLQDLNTTGLIFGLLAAVSFTVTLTATNRLAVRLPIIVRSQYMVLG